MKKHSSAILRFLQKEIDPAFARRARIILENLDLKNGMKVLDVGCGRGFYEIAISTIYPGHMVVGVDLNEGYLTVARKTVRSNSISFIKADATELPFPDNSFDRVICSEVLEHVKDDCAVLSEIHRVVKKKGKVLISVPNKHYPFLWDPLNFILERLFKKHIPSNIWWLAGIWADHVRLYDEKELLLKTQNAQLSIETLWKSTQFCFPFSHFLIYAVGKNLVEAGIVGGQFNRFDRGNGGMLVRLIKFPFLLFDRFNTNEKSPNRFLNYVYIAIK